MDFEPSAGRKNGLSIVLDMKPSERDIPSSVSNDFNGVEVNVGPRHTFPRLDTDRQCKSALLRKAFTQPLAHLCYLCITQEAKFVLATSQMIT